MSTKPLSLDQILQSPAVNAPELPDATRETAALIEVEQRLLSAVVKAGSAHITALQVVKDALKGTPGPALDQATGTMGSTRERLARAVNDLSAFSTRPREWVAEARAAGRRI